MDLLNENFKIIETGLIIISILFNIASLIFFLFLYGKGYFGSKNVWSGNWGEILNNKNSLFVERIGTQTFIKTFEGGISKTLAIVEEDKPQQVLHLFDFLCSNVKDPKIIKDYITKVSANGKLFKNTLVKPISDIMISKYSKIYENKLGYIGVYLTCIFPILDEKEMNNVTKKIKGMSGELNNTDLESFNNLLNKLSERFPTLRQYFANMK